ncbi:MAG: response regulator transcription factor [Halanaerobiales bacterium]
MSNKEDNQVINVLIVDDHPFFRQGICLYLEAIDDINITAEADDGQEAVSLLRENIIDVILMDLQMPGTDGIEATKQILAITSDVKILILTSFNSWDKVYKALQAGAAGYILKDAQPEELMAAIRAVAAGGNYFGSEVTGEIMHKLSSKSDNGPQDNDNNKDIDSSYNGIANQNLAEPLTDRELEVLQHLGRGMSNKAIAEELILSEKTVKTHLSNIFSKLQVNSRTEAAIYAMKKGLIG